jgi:hypothetical protein
MQNIRFLGELLLRFPLGKIKRGKGGGELPHFQSLRRK